jgi:hypothetical protein
LLARRRGRAIANAPGVHLWLALIVDPVALARHDAGKEKEGHHFSRLDIDVV